jgi:hypothetical protein
VSSRTGCSYYRFQDIRLRDVKGEVVVELISRYDVMHEHDNHRHAWSPLLGAFNELETQGYVAIIEGFNHSLESVPRDYEVITLFRQ